MSIETLLEAAKFLELQAQQQQKTREENELRERLRQEQEAEQRKRTEEAAAAQAVRVNSNHHHHHHRHHNHHITWVEEPSAPERRPAPLPPQPPLPSLPIAVIPIPVVPSTPAPQAAFSPATSAARSPPNLHHQQQQQGSPRNNTRSPPNGQHAHPQHVLISPQPQPEPGEPTALVQPLSCVTNKHPQQPHLVQSYPGTIVAASQHALPSPLGSPQAPGNAAARASPPDDSRNADGKKRSGAGTREVHNKLEKNRRAHLKECFETLKKNIPNVDEKKASNLSVLRSALRYIQTLKRKEKEFEHEMERLAREKIATQQRLAELKNELSQWMDVLEIDRILRQTVQPEDDQASTSTASEGEDNIEDDVEEQSPSASPPKVPQAPQPESRKPPSVPIKATILNNNHHHHHHHPHHPPTAATTSTIQHKLSPQLSLSTTPLTVPTKAQVQVPVPGSAVAPSTISSPVAALSPVSSSPLQAHTLMAPQALLAGHTHIVAAPAGSNGVASVVQPTVIAHAAPATHASVIQATVNHIIQPAGKPQVQLTQALQPPQPGQHAHPAATLAHLAPSAAAAAPQPIGHITVHPVAHLSQHHLPAIYPQPVAVTQPAMVSHIAHTLSHAQVNGASPGQMGKPVAAATAMGAQVVAHHPQLVGQTVLNPVTMVTMPSFPVSTLKLA